MAFGIGMAPPSLKFFPVLIFSLLSSLILVLPDSAVAGKEPTPPRTPLSHYCDRVLSRKVRNELGRKFFAELAKPEHGYLAANSS